MGKTTGFLEFPRRDRSYASVSERLKHYREFVHDLPADRPPGRKERHQQQQEAGSAEPDLSRGMPFRTLISTHQSSECVTHQGVTKVSPGKMVF